jgi:hypothetical protein
MAGIFQGSKKDLIDLQASKDAFYILSPEGEIILTQIALVARLTNNQNGSAAYIPIYTNKLQKILNIEGMHISDDLIVSLGYENITKGKTYKFRIYSFLEPSRNVLMNEFKDFKIRLNNLAKSYSKIGDFNGYTSEAIKYKDIAKQRILGQLYLKPSNYSMDIVINYDEKGKKDTTLPERFTLKFTLGETGRLLEAEIDDLMNRIEYNLLNSPGLPKELHYPTYRIESVETE